MEKNSIFTNRHALGRGSVGTAVNLLKGFIFPVDYSVDTLHIVR